MENGRIEVTESAREKLQAYFVENPDLKKVRIFLQQGG